MDQRPILSGNLYPIYVDGVGWRDDGARDEGYCPVCNPKNYSAWEKKIEETRREKEAAALKLHEEAEKKAAEAEEDRQRAAQAQQERFEYSNGDVYVGDMENGLPHGVGKMEYSDGSFYDGSWVHGQHDGKGVKNWCDGIEVSGAMNVIAMYEEGTLRTQSATTLLIHVVIMLLSNNHVKQYIGMWRNDMMNGQGKYTMADGTVIEGDFCDDEIMEA